MNFSNNNLRSKRPAERGSVLMIALLLVLLGTFGITAWFGLIAARSLEVNAKESAMIRRVQLNGVKEVARQLGSEAFLAMDGGKSGSTDVQLSTSYGKVTTPPWGGTPYTNTSLLRYDQVGGIPGRSFSIDISATLDDGQGALGAVDYNIQLRTYVPAQNGDLLTIHEPAVATTPVVTDSGLLINGRTVVWDGGNALGHRTKRLHTSGKASTVSLTNLAGTAILPDNETFAPRSTGSDFIGRLKAANSSESSANRYSSRLSALGAVAVDGSVASGDKSALGYDCDGAGKVYIELEHPSLPHLFITDASEIELLGQNGAANYAAAGSMDPRLIVCVQPLAGVWGPLTIVGKHENNRAIVMAVRQEGAATAVTLDRQNTVPPFPRWRMMLELENSPLLVQPQGGVSEIHLLGGIRTDASIDTTLMPLRVLQDVQSPGLEAIASRAGFVEVYRN